MKKKVFLSVAMMTTTLAMTMVSCSKDDVVNNSNETQTGYVWGMDGSIKTCDHLTFTADSKDDANGTIIGNGDKEFVFTGKQTLKKGVYLMKGWIYVADGAELTIEPGTVIKGEKASAASLLWSQVANSTPRVQSQLLSSLPQQRQRATVSLATGED